MRLDKGSVGTCKPNSVRHFSAQQAKCGLLGTRSAVAIIPLGGASPRRSSDLPGRLAGRANPLSRSLSAALIRPYLVLLRVGFAMQRSLLNARCALTAPFHPYLLAEAVCSLWHCPSDGLEAAAPGRYPAHRSVEFGLSSPRVTLSGQGRRKQRGQRPPGPNAIVLDYTLDSEQIRFGLEV